MAVLSEWLQIMLAEIARKREDHERAQEEDVKRTTEKVDVAAAPHSDAATRVDAAMPTISAGTSPR